MKSPKDSIPKISAADDEIVLWMEGKHVPPEQFLKATKAFFAMLKAATGAITGDASAVEWSVQVRAGSNVVAARGENKGVHPSTLSVRKAVSDEFSQIHRG